MATGQDIVNAAYLLKGAPQPVKGRQARGYLDLRGVYIPGTEGDRGVWGELTDEGWVRVRNWEDEGE